jgi:uncharacterized protein (TIGR02757 family)
MEVKLVGIKKLLDNKADLYERHEFIETDPIQIPHKFSKKEDIEIAGFLTSTIAWGQRKNIIKTATRLIDIMDNAPFDFVTNANENDLKKLDRFVYRTFQNADCVFFIKSLQNIYKNRNGLEHVFTSGYKEDNTIYNSLFKFHQEFFSLPHLKRTEKHLGDVRRNASAKRLNLFLRWMVRSNDRGVDFGLWKKISQSALMLPLDLHVGNTARDLGLIERKQNDWKSVEYLTSVLKKFDPQDPIKYDFALFGIGAFKNKANTIEH